MKFNDYIFVRLYIKLADQVQDKQYAMIYSIYTLRYEFNPPRQI